ncbi:MAG: tryptophan--tRNA ligase [Myxococcota bacterium]
METVFSGIQPSGELHLGNYLGAIRNWVALQEQHRCIFCIVDYHAITAPYDAVTMRRRTLDMAANLLACGIDPARATLFVQSHVPEHTELAWVLSAVTPMGELSRMTQFKEKSQQQARGRGTHPSAGTEADHVNVGLFGYPVLQAADILLYKATRVPVGKDQIQHLELAREIARRFNARFGETLPEPQPLLSSTPKIMGLDGQAKMSKSLGNTIGLLEEPDAARAKLRTAFTDPQRLRRSDPGRPEVCNVFTMHGFFSDEARLAEIDAGCRTASLGCVDCKKLLADGMLARLEPIRERARALRADETRVAEVLREGAERCRVIARETMREVREKLGLLG